MVVPIPGPSKTAKFRKLLYSSGVVAPVKLFAKQAWHVHLAKIESLKWRNRVRA